MPQAADEGRLTQFGAEIRRRREAVDRTVVEVADEIDVGHSTLYRLETGRAHKVQPRTLGQLATVFRLSPQDVRSLLEGDPRLADEVIARMKGAANAAELATHFKSTVVSGLGPEALVAIRGEELVRIAAPASARDEVIEALRSIGFVPLQPV